MLRDPFLWKTIYAGKPSIKITTALCSQKSDRKRTLKALRGCQIILHLYAQCLNVRFELFYETACSLTPKNYSLCIAILCINPCLWWGCSLHFSGFPTSTFRAKKTEHNCRNLQKMSLKKERVYL